MSTNCSVTSRSKDCSSRRRGGGSRDEEWAKLEVYCKCGVKAGKWTSWSKKNPGMRFVGCPNYKINDCGVWFWFDEDMEDRDKELRALGDEVKQIRMEMAELKRENGRVKGGEEWRHVIWLIGMLLCAFILGKLL